LREFVADLESITSGGLDPAAMIRRIAERIMPMLKGPPFLTAEQREPGTEGYARHPIHADSRGRFVVVSGVWQPGQGTPVHDHGTWGLMGVISGLLQVTTYERLDDRSRPGHARLRERGMAWCGPGSVATVLPPDEELHKVECPEVPSLTLHVYGREIEECNVYDLEAESYRPVAAE
jgi:predicted metal-dependent enzyme (double-stranded beta helix superfamily)